MNTNIKTAGKIDTKVLLSTLWIVVMINMLKADILSLSIPGVTDELAKFSASARHIHSPIDVDRRGDGESRHCHDHSIPRVEVRNQSLGRIIVGIVTIAYIWGGMWRTLTTSSSPASRPSVFLLIVWNAWKWQNVEA